MKWKSHFISESGNRFEIEEDDAVGFYFRVINNEGVGVYDTLQDTKEIAIDIAKKEYQVPKSSWKKLKEEATNRPGD